MQNWFTAVWAFAFRPRSDFIAVHARDCTGKVGPGCLARATIFTKSFRGVVLSQHCLIRCSLYRSVSRCLSPGFIRSTLMVNEKSKRGRSSKAEISGDGVKIVTHTSAGMDASRTELGDATCIPLRLAKVQKHAITVTGRLQG